MSKRLAAGLALAIVAGAPDSARPDLPPFRVREFSPMHAAAVERALAGAANRLERPECRRIFSDFRDSEGVPLQERLDRLGLAGRDYLSLVVFADGHGHRSCRGTDIMAITAPGSRVVRVCGPRFLEAQARSPERAELVLLHEALHTLGLGENPPDSLEITRRVGRRCAP